MHHSDRPSLFSPSARSIPDRRPYLRAVAFTLLHHLTLISALVLGWLVFLERDHDMLRPFAITGVAVPLTWTFSFLARRHTQCPLCRGTPLLDSSASKHRKALRIPLFNYGNSAVLHLLLTGRFRCMYCGTPFQLLKKSRGRPQEHH